VRPRGDDVHRPLGGLSRRTGTGTRRGAGRGSGAPPSESPRPSTTGSASPIESKIHIHINNTDPILLEDTPERRLLTEGGMDVAHDGLEVEGQAR
jgi:hypothetical protein